MLKEEILKICVEKSVLLDNEILEAFSGVNDLETIKFIIEKIKTQTQKRFITKDVLKSNKNILENFIKGSNESKEYLKKLKIKLGLNLEISTTTYSCKEVESDFGNVKINSSFSNFVKSLEVKDFVKHFRKKFNNLRNILELNSKLKNIVSINKINKSRGSFSIIGIVFDKKISKNKNIILDVEDLTGRTKLLINNSNKEVYEKAQDIVLDSTIGFNCTGSNNFLFVKDFVFPNANLSLRKKSNLEEYALFIGDLHFGSKKFMKKEFLNFIKYLNGELSSDIEIKKIKYLFIVGDLITGVGNYPNQERDLQIINLEQQFEEVAELLGKIRKDIKIIICPGNHDCVRLMEPQPLLNEKYAWPLHDLKNIILVENPCNININSNQNFEGFNVLMYHGFSFPYYANNVYSLIAENSMNNPEKIMKYLLINRHLAPTHSSVQYYPCEKDTHFINKIPDIFVAGHTHKSGIFYYNNILIISTSTWEEMTPYQEKFGNEPDHCKVPMINLKTRQVKILDFEEPVVEETKGTKKISEEEIKVEVEK